MYKNELVEVGCLPTVNGIMNKQGYHVYSSNGSSCNLCSTTGGLGGTSGLYLEIKGEEKCKTM